MVDKLTKLRLGLVIFLLVNFLFITYQTVKMGQPRLGDDALTYLYKGLSFNNMYSYDYPTLKSILDFDQITFNSTEDARFYGARVTMRHFGSLTPGYDWLPFLTMKSGLTQKWQWYVIELIIMLILGFGIYYLGLALWPKFATNLSLIILSVIIFPAQGIHYFIPGVMSLGFALITFGLLERSEQKPLNLLALFAAVFACVSLHPIGKVYIAIVIALYIYKSLIDGNLSKQKAITTILAFICVLLFCRLEIFKLPLSNYTGRIANINELKENISFSLFMIFDSLRQNKLLIICLWAPIYFIFIKSSFKGFALIAFAVGIFAASQMFYLPGYPGELWSRIQIPIFVLMLGLSLTLLADRFANDKRFQIVLLILFSYGIYTKARFAAKNAAMRSEIVNEDLLAKKIQELPPHETVVLCETDISYPYLALNSALQKPLIFSRYFVEQQAAYKSSKTATHLIPIPPHFNFNAMNRTGFVEGDRLGFNLDKVKNFWIENSSDNVLHLSLMFDDLSSQLTLQAREKVNIRINSKPNAGWLRGIKTDDKPDLNWAWNKGIILNYQIAESKPIKQIELSTEWINSFYNCHENKFRSIDVISDDSGFIFAKVSY